MSVAVLAGRSLVAVVLLAAGSAKLADLRGFRATLAGLGISSAFQTLVAFALIVLELGLGFLSLTLVAPVITDLSIFAVTIAFASVAVVGASRTPGTPCRCFGSLAEDHFGSSSVYRSMGLAAVAGTVLAGQLALEDRPSMGVLEMPLLLAAALLFSLGSMQAARAIAVAEEGRRDDSD